MIGPDYARPEAPTTPAWRDAAEGAPIQPISEMRFALGITVFSGMLGVTAFGIFFTPVFYSVIRSRSERGPEPATVAPTPAQHSVPAVGGS